MWKEHKSGLFVPEGVAKPHHSLADWDLHSGLTYVLDNSIFVSSPSSLKLSAPTIDTWQPVLSRAADCLDLEELRIETQWRSSELSGTYVLPCLYLRQQSTLGNFDTDNTYILRFGSGSVTCLKRVAAAQTTIGSWTRAHAEDTFHRERVACWMEALSLFFRYEYWTGSAWAIVTPDVADNSPSFGGSATNRCGVGLWRLSGAPAMWFDDTRIEWA